jgi:hypothetical protein
VIKHTQDSNLIDDRGFYSWGCFHLLLVVALDSIVLLVFFVLGKENLGDGVNPMKGKAGSLYLGEIASTKKIRETVAIIYVHLDAKSAELRDPFLDHALLVREELIGSLLCCQAEAKSGGILIRSILCKLLKD